MIRGRWVLLLAALFLARAAHAQLAVDRLWIDFDAGSSPRSDLLVRNESKDRYYITVSPAELVNPGTPAETRVEQADPDKLGLLVTPNRLILDPDDMRAIRIVALDQDRKADRVYRIRVSPEIGAIDAGEDAAADRSGSLKLLAAYDILVTLRPRDPRVDIVARRDGAQITLQNNGNTNALLFDGVSCPAGAKVGDAACIKVGAKRMFAGNSWVLHLKAVTDTLHFKQRISAALDPKDVTF